MKREDWHAHPVHEWDGHPEPRWPLWMSVVAGIVIAIGGAIFLVLAIALLGE